MKPTDEYWRRKITGGLELVYMPEEGENSLKIRDSSKEDGIFDDLAWLTLTEAIALRDGLDDAISHMKAKP